MSIRFEFFRIFVEEAVQTSLFGNDQLTKSDVIKLGFDTDEPVEFSARSTQLAYVKFITAGQYIVGSIGRKSVLPIVGPPAKKFELTRAENWPHVLLVVNTSSDKPIGQSIAMVHDPATFRAPVNQLKHLTDELTQRFTAPEGYVMLLESISDKKNFWEIIDTYQGRLQKLTFNLSAPNFLGLNDELSHSMKKANELYNITNTELSIENKEGKLNVPRDDNFITQASEYASQGGGDIKLKIRDGGTISGKSRTYSATISSEDYDLLVKAEDLDTLKQICDKLFLCLKDLD